MWTAYDYLLLYADGFGGFSIDTVRWYLEQGPGARLSSEGREDVITFLPDLIREERTIQAEEMDKIRKGRGSTPPKVDRDE